MIIDTIISSLIDSINERGYDTTTSPIDLFIQSNQVINDIVSVTEGDSDLEPYEAHNNYITTSNIDVVISVKTNDNSISLERAHQMRDAVIDIIRSYSDYQIIIQRINKDNVDTGTVQITLYCSVQYPIT